MLISILTALIAAIIGSYLTLLTFKRQRLWQERYESYRDLISAVEKIRYWGEEMSNSVYMVPTTGFPDGVQPYEYLNDAMRKVEHYRVAGSLLFNEEFCQLIDEFLKKIYSEKYKVEDDGMGMEGQEAEFHFGSHAVKVRDLVDEYFPKIIKLAKHDL